jgi:hypothetical protein
MSLKKRLWFSIKVGDIFGLCRYLSWLDNVSGLFLSTITKEWLVSGLLQAQSYPLTSTKTEIISWDSPFKGTVSQDGLRYCWYVRLDLSLYKRREWFRIFWGLLWFVIELKIFFPVNFWNLSHETVPLSRYHFSDVLTAAPGSPLAQ